jgi:hypothetical protein
MDEFFADISDELDRFLADQVWSSDFDDVLVRDLGNDVFDAPENVGVAGIVDVDSSQQDVAPRVLHEVVSTRMR